MVGRQSLPNPRGTINAMWSCVTNMIPTAWVMLHLNVPAKKHSEGVRLARKFKRFCLAIMCSEILMPVPGGQRASAARPVADVGNQSSVWRRSKSC